MTVGHSALVGVGSGDPALLTLRAAELLRSADLVIHEVGLSEALLAMIPGRARLCERSNASQEVHTAIQAGERVVWLAVDVVSAASEVRQLFADDYEVVPGVDIDAERVISRPQSPLFGRSVIVARARSGLSEVGRRARDAGARVLELPHVERSFASSAPLALSSSGDVGEGDLALLSSVDAVEAWLDSGLVQPVIALGGDVVAMLRVARITPEIVLAGACLEAMMAERERLRGRRVLILVPENAATSLFEPLRALGAIPVLVRITAQHRFAPARWPNEVDLVLLPSSLAALALYESAPTRLLSVPAIAIGPQSAARATRSGVRTVYTAARDTVEALLDRAHGYFEDSEHGELTQVQAVNL